MSNDEIHLDPKKIPHHIAIIMDGNRRWAQKNSVSLIEGHRQGLERVVDILDACNSIGVKILTLFAFSKENWKRSHQEINDLMKLFKFFFNREFNKIKENNIRVLHSGLKNNFGKDIQNIINTLVDETKNNTKSVLNLAINYSGRQEIIEGIKSIVIKSKNCCFDIQSMDEEDFRDFLFHPEIPDPDLLIRTSGEQRISNFLLWQSAYTEFYFTDVLWPDFRKENFLGAIHEFQKRERRFGGRFE